LILRSWRKIRKMPMLDSGYQIIKIEVTDGKSHKMIKFEYGLQRIY